MRVDDELYEFLKKAPLEEVMKEEPLFLPEEPRGKKKRRVYVSLKQAFKSQAESHRHTPPETKTT